MCSRKWLTPHTSGVSSREPVRTKNPTATERADGLDSPISSRPLGRVCLWKGIDWVLTERRGRRETKRSGHPERLRADGHDAELLRRVALQVVGDPLARQALDGRLDLVEGAHPAQVVP